MGDCFCLSETQTLGTAGSPSSTGPLRLQGQQDLLSNYHPLQDSAILTSGNSIPFLIGQQEKGDREKAMGLVSGQILIYSLC